MQIGQIPTTSSMSLQSQPRQHTPLTITPTSMYRNPYSSDCAAISQPNGTYCKGSKGPNDYCYSVQLDSTFLNGSAEGVDDMSKCNNHPTCADLGSYCGASFVSKL